MSIDFLSPGYLLLAAAVPLVWILPRRLRDIGLGLLRSAVLVLVIVAAARPVSYGEDARAWHVVVLDASASLGAGGERARDVADRRLGRVPARDQTALVIVGTSEDAAALAEVSAAERTVRVGGARGGSPLGAGLAAASRAIPVGARGSVTLISDGLATDRHWGSAAAELSARGIPVHVVAVTPAQPTAAVIGVTLPDVLRVGATARVEARVTGAAGVTADVRLLGPAGELAVQRDVVFGSVVLGGDGLGGDASVVLAFEPEAPGFLPLTVRIDAAADSMHADDALRVTAAVQDPLRVLYLGRRMVEGDARLDELVGRGFALTSVPTGEPLTPKHVAAADLVVIDDRPADSVPAPVQEAVASAVREGRTGLLMCGGRAAFGAGGYARSPLAAVLPVEMVQKEEKRDPSTTLAIVIDTSGSMGGNRVQLAKEVARLAIRRLLPHDKVGIVEFYGAKRWAAPIQPASNAIEIQRALNRLNAGGGTVIMPAIEEAFYGLQNVRTRYKHVLVLTDGGVEQGAFEPLVRRMASKGITVSTVLIGPDAHSEFLVSIANWGKGRFYSVPNRFNLPEILLKQPASAHLPSWRPGPHAVDPRGGPGWWGAQDGAQVPALGGYVESRARTGAETLLEVRSTRHPVLATWRYGAGRATALLTEPTGPGTSAWRNWEGYGETLARVLARTASDTRPPYAFELARRARALTLSARRQTPSAGAPAARRVDSGGAPLRFRERAPGFFEARFDAAPESEVRVAAGVAGTLDTRLVSSARADVTPELQVDPRNALDLALLAGATSGEFAALADADRLPRRSGGGSAPAAVRPIWPWCLLLALVLYLLELAWRRRSRSLRTEMDA